MRLNEFVVLGSVFTGGLSQAAVIPSPPPSCAEEVAQKGFCTETLFTNNAFPFTIRFFAVVDKAVYPNVDSLLAKYFAFGNWPDYVKSTGNDNIIYLSSQSMPDKEGAQGSKIVRHYFDYKIRSPIGFQHIRGVTHNTLLKVAHEGAVSTTEFEVQTTGEQEVPKGEKPLVGAEGLKLQYGSVSTISCEGQTICGPEQWLVLYESTITPAVNLLPKSAAAAVEKGITDVIVGMLFN